MGVWGVVSGEYSDYTVHSIYTTKAEAEAAAEEATRMDGNKHLGEFTVEEFPLGARPVRAWVRDDHGMHGLYVTFEHQQARGTWMGRSVSGTDRDEVEAMWQSKHPDTPEVL